MNYISNAIKYGGKPPTITFGAEQLSDGFVRYWSTDNDRRFLPEEHFGGQLIHRFALQEIPLFFPHALFPLRIGMFPFCAGFFL
jgi:hypothetical protein